jgi:3-hydroxyisobutyrate dehydrogenase
MRPSSCGAELDAGFGTSAERFTLDAAAYAALDRERVDAIEETSRRSAPFARPRSPISESARRARPAVRLFRVVTGGYPTPEEKRARKRGVAMAETTVAVLGTGTMGAPIARNLLEDGFDVRVWNRTREKADPLGEAGATVCATAAEAVAGAAFVLTSLADADATAEVMDEGGALGGMAEGAVWIQVATVGVSGAEELAELASEHGVAYVDAPLLGTKEPAEKGTLVVLASGPDELRQRCEPVFDAIGKETRWVGEAGAGSRLKMVTNMWLLAVTEAVAEALALAEGLDLDPNLFLETMAGSQIDTPYLHIKGKKILERSLEPSFTLALAEKDASLVLEAAGRAGIELAVARAVHERFVRGVQSGHGDEDMAATYFATAGEDAPRSR